MKAFVDILSNAQSVPLRIVRFLLVLADDYHYMGGIIPQFWVTSRNGLRQGRSQQICPLLGSTITRATSNNTD